MYRVLRTDGNTQLLFFISGLFKINERSKINIYPKQKFMKRQSKTLRYLTEIQGYYIIVKIKAGSHHRQIVKDLRTKDKRKISLGTIAKLKEKEKIFGNLDNQNSRKC